MPGQRKKIVKFNEELDAGQGTSREEEDRYSKLRLARYRARAVEDPSFEDAVEAENGWRVSIGLEPA